MRVLIADDSVLLREGLRLILDDAGHTVLECVGDGEAMRERALALRPDLVICDIRMPPSHTDEGLRASVALRGEWPGAPILLLSQYIVVAYAEELLAAGQGSIGYLLKDRVSEIDTFLAGAERVAGGGMVLDPDVVAQVMSTHRKDDAGRPLNTLTPRERDTLELMARGESNAGIAEALVVSEGAVEKNIQRIFAKLGLHGEDGVNRRVKAVLKFLSQR